MAENTGITESEILKKKKQILEDEYSDDGIIIGKNHRSTDKELKEYEKEEGSVNIGSMKRETLENGQRVVVLTVDKEMMKLLTPDKEGNYTISIKSDRHNVDDFLHQEIKISSKDFKKLNPNEDGMINLLVYEKVAGGELTEKRDLEVMKDTEENRKSIIEKNPDVEYKGEETIREREKIMDTAITPNIKFRDVYNQMNEQEKGTIDQKENEDLKTFISDNKKPMENIEEIIKSKEMLLKQKDGSKVFKNNGEGEKRTVLICAGVDGSGKVSYKNDKGGLETLNPYEIGEKIDISKDAKQKISKESFREAITGFKLVEKQDQGLKI